MLPSPTAHPLLSEGGDERSHGHASKSLCTPTRLRVAMVAYFIAAVCGWWYLMPMLQQSAMEKGSRAATIVDVYPGAPWRTEQTVSSKLLLSDKRNRVESHTVRTEDGNIITDWLWMDVIDHINVVPFVLTPPPSADGPSLRRWNKWRHGEFLIFKQRKYGLREESYAVAGGQVEMAKGELPLATAQRELREELFLVGDPDAWVDLGSYRVNVNRGHGIVSCYLLADARPVHDGTDTPEALAAEFKVDELERQTVLRVGVEEMARLVRTHAFGEIKWQATAVMALQVIQQRIDEEDRRIRAEEGTSSEQDSERDTRTSTQQRQQQQQHAADHLAGPLPSNRPNSPANKSGKKKRKGGVKPNSVHPSPAHGRTKAARAHAPPAAGGATPQPAGAGGA